ncbi:latent transforming growth factor beta-binding protein [Archangium violaceum]|uniref:Dickkopf N-terminal cysteine-rich domain-containing protein n=1 Tax=Archangium violaceum TaxID=83451 RepID=UPI00194E93F2|nr:Dickkopf N-terminal cysteine-rich domain-containing protein [Archangium violaceum]QRO02298.1 latent transforming growth factor beta-binding protein [Archangium violaceum]
MHRLVRLVVPLALVTVLGCPLDIEVREPPLDTDAGPRACVKDQDCPEGQRCDDAYSDNHCEPGPRVTQSCTGDFTCSYLASCVEGRCELGCLGGRCRPGYQCAPDRECVEACSEGAPTKLGDYCDGSTDCGRCGFCVALSGSGEKRCHQPCTSDTECGGETGACQKVTNSTLHVCRLP